MDDVSTTSYDADIVAWAEEQAAAVRALGRRPELSNALDWENVAEEIESLGRSQIGGVERKLTLVLVHLLKKLSAPDAPPGHLWRAEIITFQIAARKTYSRSMRQRIDWQDLWTSARKEASAELMVYGDTLISGLPDDLPFSPEDLIARDFDPDTALSLLADALSDRRSDR